MIKKSELTLADSICDLRVSKIKKSFFEQLNNLLDWRSISKIINKHYTKGKSAVGTPSYDGLLLFKICLLQTWYGLSDYEVEDRVNDSLSFSYFCGMSIEESSPDHSTISRFRKVMTESKSYDKLFKEINKQLKKHGIIVKQGVLLDASIIDTPLKPKGKKTYKVTQSEEESEIKVERNYPDSVDQEASWIKKRGSIRYGYKKHYVSDEEGLVLGVVTTPGNINEISNLEEVLDSVDLPEGISLKADKGYQSQKNKELLKKRKLKNHILKKAAKNRPLTNWEKQFNKLVGKTRFKIERTFGSIKRWFNGGKARYKGLAKMHTQNLMEAICYNLYRVPGIIASNCKNKAK